MSRPSRPWIRRKPARIICSLQLSAELNCSTVHKGLVIPPEQAPGKLEFTRENGGLTLLNPTPYYLTVTDLKAGNKSLENTMVPPLGKVTVNIPGGYTGGDITYKTINDYGALTEQVRGVVK